MQKPGTQHDAVSSLPVLLRPTQSSVLRRNAPSLISVVLLICNLKNPKRPF